jgi:hypothetical protein
VDITIRNSIKVPKTRLVEVRDVINALVEGGVDVDRFDIAMVSLTHVVVGLSSENKYDFVIRLTTKKG